MRHLISFKPQFAEMIEAGTKRQTIRKARKRPIQPGDTLILCTGLRTKDYRKIGEAVCTQVDSIRIRHLTGVIWINGHSLRHIDMDRLARADGFLGVNEFEGFFKGQYGEGDFEGVLIHWDKLEVKP